MRDAKNSGLQTVDLKRLPDEVTSTAEFLKSHLKGRIKTKGNQIQVEGVKHKEVKLLLHKFLHKKGLEGYRVLSQSGALEIVPPLPAEKHRREEGTPPPASSTMPYLFPNTAVSVPVDKIRSKKKVGTHGNR